MAKRKTKRRAGRGKRKSRTPESAIARVVTTMRSAGLSLRRAAAEESVVREGLAKLKQALADPMCPPDTGEYCALLDDASLCSEDGLLKRVSAQTGVDWRHMNAGQRAVVERLMQSFEEKTMQVTGDFCRVPRCSVLVWTSCRCVPCC